VYLEIMQGHAKAINPEKSSILTQAYNARSHQEDLNPDEKTRESDRRGGDSRILALVVGLCDLNSPTISLNCQLPNVPEPRLKLL